MHHDSDGEASSSPPHSRNYSPADLAAWEATRLEGKSSWDSDNRPLSRADAARYHDDGVLGPVPVLNEDEASTLLARLSQVVSEEEERAGGEWWDREFYPQQQDDHPLNVQWLDDLVTDPRILNPVACLIGEDILIQNVAVFWKEAESERGQAWHRDLYEEVDPAFMVTVWIALTSSDEGNGCLSFLAGSHGVHRAERPSDEALAAIPQEMTRSMELAPGEASFHNAGILHASAPNRSSRPRVGIALRYVGGQVDRGGEGDMLQATLVRGADRRGQYRLIPRYCVAWWSAGAPRRLWNTRPAE